MVKKVVLGVLFAGLIAVLLIGAVNRTLSKTRSSNDQGNGTGKASGASANLEWETFQGMAVDVTTSELLLQSSTGEQWSVRGKGWSYAQEQGFSAYPTESIAISGFYKNNEFVIGSLANNASGQTVLIRDPDGRPMWSGRGRGG